MNIPEITIEAKPGLHSESAAQAKAMERHSSRQEMSPPNDDTVSRQESKRSATQSYQLTRDQLDTMLTQVEEQFMSKDVKLKFNVLEENETIQIEIIDSAGKTIRKIPEDDLLKLSKSLKNLGKGFFDQVS